MSVLAAIRPDDVNLPLFLHVFGAMLLVGVMLTVAIAFVMSGRSEPDAGARLTRFGLRTMLFAAFPTYLLMRVGAQWTESQEDLPDDFEASWLDVGYITADLGALLIIASMVLSARGLRRLAAGGGGAGQARAVGIISVVLLVAYLVAVYAMSAKP